MNKTNMLDQYKNVMRFIEAGKMAITKKGDLKNMETVSKKYRIH